MIEIDVNLIRKMIVKEKRIDNRKSDDYRNVMIEKNIISSAEGSSRVKIGDSEVIAGVKLGIGEPYPDTPNEGTMMVSAELVPLASPEFESGPPSEESIELARVVDRAIRESKCIDFEKLCIEPRKTAWTVFIDIDVLNDDGNLIDASGLAAITALLITKMPELEKDEEKYRVNYEKKESNLPVKGIPVSTTFVKIDDSIIVDPNLAEWKAMQARLTIGTIDGKICSLQKGGSQGFSLAEIENMAKIAEKKGNELRKMIELRIK